MKVTVGLIELRWRGRAEACTTSSVSNHIGLVLSTVSEALSASGRMSIYTTVCRAHGALENVCPPLKGETGELHELSLDADESE